MNEVYDLLLKIKGLGGKVYVTDGKLKLDIEKGRLTPEIAEEIRKYRDDLIAFIEQSFGKNEFSEIPALSQEQLEEGSRNGFPISDAQRRLWVLSQFEEGSIAYNIPGNIYLDANVNIEHFKKALNAVVERHEILRTVFRTDSAGEVKQWILSKEELGFKIDYFDLRNEENKHELIQQHLWKNARKLFDLENGPLFSSGLLQVEDADFVYFYNMHHIISDGWSFTVFFRDLELLYKAFAEGVEPIIEDLRIQYKDYSVWQVGELSNEFSNEHRNYWLEYLKGEIPRITLPSSKPRPRIMTFNGQTMNDQYIGPGTINKLKKYSEVQNGSPFMVLFAAWSVLMYRYTKLRDITIGTPLSGREHVDLKNQIGFYVNTLAIRLDVRPEESFNDFFSRVKDNMLRSYSHQMYPFNRLVEELEIPRDASRSVLFDVMLVYNGSDQEGNTEAKKDDLGNIADVEYTTSKFDIEIGFRDQGDHFTVWGVFNPDVYDQPMIEGLIGHYKQLLRVLMAAPETAVGSIDFMSKREKEQLTIDFNNTQAEYPQLGIAEVFEQQVALSPDAVALIFSDGSNKRVELSYGELNALSNQFAEYLQERYQLEREDLVGCRLDRDHKVMVAILGILKSGAAYVPIDPSSPTERIAAIEHDCKCCIDASVFNDFLTKQSNYRVTNPSTHAGARDLAYVMYTSGSTGTPKGVMIEQRSVVRLVKNNGFYDFSPSDKLLATGSLGFDATILEFFGPLLNGGTLVLCPKETLLSPELLEKEIVDHCINIMWFTAGWFNQLIDVHLGLFAHLSTVLAGGDRLSAPHVRKLREAYADLTIINGYGPTENTTFSLTHRIDHVTDEIPIGRPISNSSVYILDDQLGLQPIGVTGELYLGGDGLARGYLNNPDLTTETFIVHPTLSNDRLYKSGDLGYWREDGCVVFVGRDDDQVKIRGYRIELGEIEQAFGSNAQINQNVVTVLDHEGEKELAVYFTASSEQNQQDLKIYLEEKLPAYMIPAYFIQMDGFALNENGKIDKKALPHPSELGVSSGNEYLAPETDLQAEIVAIWEEVLNRTHIGIKDDFFELGGHSLRIVRLNNEYQKQFGVKLSSKDLFKHSSISAHAQLLETAGQQNVSSIPMLSPSELKAGSENGFLISDAQRRLWILSQFDGGSAAYNIPGHVLLDDEINIDCFRQAVHATIERHEILRTVFRTNENNEVRQWVLDMHEFPFQIGLHDFRGENPQAVDQFILNDSFKPFDLEKGPLLRAELLQIHDDRYIFYYNMHHIISDGWSMDVLTKDILSSYNWFMIADGRTTPKPLPELRIQYKEYASWLYGELRENPLYEKQKNYWKNKLSGDLPALNLPTSQQRPLVKSHNGKTLGSYLSGTDTAQIKAFVSERGGTLFSGLLAVWNVLMYRYTGQTDVLTGSPVAGREHLDLENQIGFYVNTMVLRNQILPNEAFNAFYERLKEDAFESIAHQIYPFDRLVDELEIQRDTSRNAVFDVMFMLQNNGEKRAADKLSDDELDTIQDLGDGPSKFDITISFEEVGDYVSINLIFNPDVYDQPMIEGLIGHYKQLLRVLMASPETAVGSIDFMSKREKEQLTIDFNNTQAEYPQLGITEVFEQQVALSPDAVALIFSDGSNKRVELSYGELNALSNQFAEYLQERYQLEREDLVGCRLDRDHKVMVAILGILKSGAAYVPIDPSSPTERIAAIEHDCKCCIDASVFNDFLTKQSNYRVTNPSTHAGARDLAYVMYTSGSTGTPKGVMIEQRSVVRLVKNNGFYDFSPSDKLLATGSLGFDATILEFFGPLLNGGTLVLCPKETLLSPELLEKEIVDHRINIMWFTAGWFNQLIDVHLGLFAHLSTVLAGGDRLSAPHVGKLREAYADLTIINGYGPTENTTFSLTHRIDHVTDEIPIGRPISNSSVYILDGQLGLQPMGVTGELYLGGDGVARGYLNNPDLTAETFIVHPTLSNDRLYKSGDLGYWREDGCVVFVGRDDDQVKIRGYRIELGEIEQAFGSHAQINQNVVTVLDHEGEKELAVYFTASSEQNQQDLKIYLEEKLPAYMIPAYFIQMDGFALNENGKIDKKALPHPSELGVSSGNEYLAPETDLQAEIVAIWEEVLNRTHIGIKDDFFELGGHSLRAMRVMNGYQKTFGVKLSMNELFAVTTPVGHAKLIESGKAPQLAQIPIVSNQESYAISDAQRRIWVLSQFEEGSIAYNMPGHLVVNDQIDIELFKKAIYATIERHEVLRTVFRVNDGGEVRQFIRNIDELGIHIQEMDLRGEENVRSKIDALIRRSDRYLFDLENGPLLNMKIVRSNEQEYVFIYNMHHIIGDGWSLDVLEQDILAFYTAFAENRLPQLDPLRIQYKDYAAWQLGEMTTEAYVQHEQFWLNELSGELPVLELPIGKKRPAVKTTNGEMVLMQLSEELTNGINAFTTREGGTVFMSLLSIWQVLLYKYSGQTDVIIGTPIAGRDHADLSNQIGCYVNTLALRNTVDSNESFASFYRKVKEKTVESYGHQMYPFDRLVEKLKVPKDTSRNPVFDVMLTITNNAFAEIPNDVEMDNGTHIRHLGATTAKFDLDLTFQESGGRLVCYAIFNSDIYEVSVIEQLLLHFEELTKNLLADPIQSLGAVNYLKEEEIDVQLNQFASTEVRPAIKHTFQTFFEDQVAKTPNNKAIEFKSTVWTYRELNQKANGIAHYLRERYGVKRNDLVGIELEKSPWIVAVILGIMKSGAAYVPIDPNYPAERREYMRKDSNATLVFEQAELITCISLLENHENVPKSKSLSDLAYVIYTSGTTGKPKGVMITEHSLIDYAVTFKDTFQLSESDRIIQQASLAFDTHVEEIFPILLTGGTILMGENGGSDIEELTGLVENSHATILSATPLILKSLNDEKSPLSNLRLLISGGDKFDSAYVSNFMGKFEIYDSYGPSESTVCATYTKIESEREKTIIGKPITNREMYILGDHQQLLPMGSVGEMYIGGSGLAVGYLNQPELTQEKFVKHPFKVGEHLYQSGDLGKWLPTGEIEFFGRKDDQIKIRGYRIELGEIEATLSRVDGINNAVVLTRENQHQQLELVAFCISNQLFDVDAIRNQLSRQLPDYMMPTHLLNVDNLPVTANGKVDKAALISWAQTLIQSEREHTPARNELEKRWLSIWQQELKTENLGIDDDFFENGGNSIMAVRISRTEDLHIPLKTIYQERTIRKCLEALGRRGETELIEPIKSKRESGDNILLIPYAGATDVVYYQLAQKLSEQFNVFVVSMPWHSLGEDIEYHHHDWVESKLMEEIQRKVSGRTFILGHCAGTILALSLSQQLEKMNFPLAGVFQCAENYQNRYNIDLENGGWSYFSDEEIWNDVILKLGFEQEGLHEKTKQQIIKNLRHDARIAEHIASRIQTQKEGPKLKAPIHAIYGENDPLTHAFEEEYKKWGLVSEHVSYGSIKNGGHYFVNQNSEETVTEICKQVNRWKEQKVYEKSI